MTRPMIANIVLVSVPVRGRETTELWTSVSRGSMAGEGARGGQMPLNIGEGDSFPDVSMLDHDGESRSISEIARGKPLFLAFFRGPW